MRYFINLIICLFFMLITTACTDYNSLGLPNPWVDCDNNTCAKKIAGFVFPLEMKDCKIRTMKDMIEITYPLDNSRYVTVRKSLINSGNDGDISGDYNSYPLNKQIMLFDAVPVQIRGENEDKIYVMNFSASTGYYSAVCKEGMTYDDIVNIYETIRQVEEPKIP